MAAKNLSGNLVMAAIIIAGVYVYMNRDTLLAEGGNVAEFAEASCRDAAKGRFGFSNVRIYRVKKTNTGYLVGATARLERGDSAKIVCLTNAQGGVEDISLEER